MEILIYTLIIAGYFISFWKLFEKAGRKPWEGIVPFYNFYIWLKVIKKPWWWILLLVFPGVNILMLMVMNVNLAIVFGKRDFMHYLLSAFLPFIYLPYIAYTSNIKYVGPIDKSKVKKSAAREWGDAIIFAVIAASIIRVYFIEAFTIPTSSMEKSLLVGDYLFVSKVNYGPKVPQTPLAFPFAHHTMPGTETVKSYLEWIKLPYMRLPGFEKVERNDIVVFNFPAGDTVVIDEQVSSYEQIVRNYSAELKNRDQARKRPLKDENTYLKKARALVLKSRDITVRPVDKRENYIKRNVAMPGDTLEVKNAVLYVNGAISFIPEKLQYNFFVESSGLNKNTLKNKYDISYEDMREIPGYSSYIMPLTLGNYDAIKEMKGVRNIQPSVAKKGRYDPANRIFPNHPDYDWTEDHFGPLYVPEEGATIHLTAQNLPIYERIITVYEGNDVGIKNDKIFINGEETDSYTFKMNYYFMMGDNRHKSADSRFWGFVPEDHIVGKAVFIWLSLDKEKSLFGGKIRWDRMFSLIH